MPSAAILSFKKIIYVAVGEVCWLKALTALAKDLGLVPGTHVRWLKTNCNPSSRGSNNLFWLLHVCGAHTLTHIKISD